MGSRRGRRAGLRQRDREDGESRCCSSVLWEKKVSSRGGRWEPTSKTARQGPMPLNEMTVGKVEWGVDALEAWGGPG